MTHRPDDSPAHPGEPHLGTLSQRMNWLRAGVLGANDGIVSTAGLVVGVAGATGARGPILTAGVAGLVAGAVSMALGEYVSVSSQRDTERWLLAKERRELEQFPEAELEELAAMYRARGLSSSTARQVAEDLTAKDAFAAHVDIELGIDPDDLTNPWHAAGASAVSFTLGSLLPLLAILLPPADVRVRVTFIAVLLALAVTGAVSAAIGGARRGPAVARLVIGGALAMAVTFGVGQLVGTAAGRRVLDAAQHLAGHQQDHRGHELTTDSAEHAGQARCRAVRLREIRRHRRSETGTTRNAQVASHGCSGGCCRSTRATGRSTIATRKAYPSGIPSFLRGTTRTWSPTASVCHCGRISSVLWMSSPNAFSKAS